MEEKTQARDIAEEAREKTWTHKSFAKGLFMGACDFSLIHPFPFQSAEDKEKGDAFINKLEPYLLANLDPDAVDATGEVPAHVFKGLGERGVFAMKIPQAYGGLGFSVTNYNRAVMKISSYCSSTGVLVSAHQSIGVPQPLLMFGTEEQKKKYFPWFVQGKISAFALTEPEVGSDPAKMTAEARLSDDGSHYILNGTKLWCTNGPIADVIVVMAKTAPQMVNGKEKVQISAFILEMDTPGVRVVHRCRFMGLNGIYNGVLEFQNVKIPRENLIGKEGRGLAMALATINVGRLTLPAQCTGAAKQLLAIARRWGKERIQWGLPIGLHEAGKQKVSYIAATTFAMEAVCWLASSFADQGSFDIRMEAAMAKYFCTEELWKIADLTMQLRGGRGYETAASLKERGESGWPVERIMRDCRVNTILEGSSEIMRLFLAREAMDPHLQNIGFLLKKDAASAQKSVKLLKLIAWYGGWYSKQCLSQVFTFSPSSFSPLATHMAFVKACAHKLARYMFYYMVKYRQGLESRQATLSRLMDIGTELFAIAAACSYAIGKVRQNPGNSSPYQLANYFSLLARERIEQRFSTLRRNSDQEMNLLGQTLIDEDFSWLEEGILTP